MKTKKLLALIMALAMLLSSLPMAFADAVTEPEEPISEWGEVDLSDAAGEPVVEDEEDADLVQELPDDGEPIEEPEDPELVNDNVNYVVKVIFNYSGAPGQDDVELTLQNGVLTAKQEASLTPAEWEGHEFLGWQSADFDEEEVVALEEGDDPRMGLKEGTLSSHTFSNSTTVYVNAVWKTEYFEVLFKNGTPDANAIMPKDLKDYAADEGPDFRVEYGTILGKEDVAVFAPQEPVDGYDYENPIYKVNGEEIDIATYEIKEKTVITVEIPLQTVTVSFYLDADDEEAWLEQPVEYGSFAERPEEDPTDEHRTFLDWYKTGEADPFDFEDPILGDTDLYADWEAELITVTFDPAGGEINGSTENYELPIEYKTAIGNQAPEPVKEGMYFVGWLLDGEDFDTDTEITEAITLTANYTAEPVYLTYVRTGFTGEVPDNNEVWPLDEATEDPDDEINEFKQTGVVGGAVTPFDGVTREGYTLAGWWDGETVDKDGNPVPFDFSEVKEDADNLTAIWVANPITITLVAGHDGVTFAKNGEDGKPLAFTATVASHYGQTLTLDEVQEDEDVYLLLPLNDIHDFDFLNWYTPDEDQYGDPIKVKFVGPQVLTEDITLYADWDEYYTVTMYDGVYPEGDNKGKPIPFEFDQANVFNEKGEIRVYPEIPVRRGDIPDNWTTVEKFKEHGEEIYAELDAENMEAEGAQYFDGFFDADGNEFDLVEDTVDSDLTLTAKRLDLVKVTFKFNGGWEAGEGQNDEGPRNVLYPKGKTLKDAEDLRGAERFPIPVLTKDHNTFNGYKKGTDIWGEEDPFTEATELIAYWIPTKWTVTLDLDGGLYAYDTEYEVTDGDPLDLEGEKLPTKTDCIFNGWVTIPEDEDGNKLDPVPFIPGPKVEEGDEPTPITADTTVYATWITFAAKDKTATGDPEAEPTKYYATLNDAFTAEPAAKDIVILQDFTGEKGEYPAIADDLDFSDNGTIKSVDMGGHTLELAEGAYIIGNEKVTFKNGKIIGTAATLYEDNSTWLVDINIASGSYENVYLYPGEQAISGGKFRWTEPEGFEPDEEYATWDEYVEDAIVGKINEKNWVVEGKKLYLKNGWYTPTEYKTLTIYWDKASAEEDQHPYGVTVFKGENTEIPEEVEDAIENSDDKFQKWLIYDAEAEEGAEPEEFTFGATLTEDTVIYGDWIKAVTVTFWVYGYKLWEQETYSDQLIEEPVEPTEDDYAEMTNSQEADVRGAWEIIHSDGFLGWRYDDWYWVDEDEDGEEDEGEWHEGPLNGVNVKFGVDKARDINIYAATKNQITFYGLGNEVVDVLWLDDGETVNDHGGMPEAPEVEGYTFNYWLDEGNWDNAEIFKPNKKIYEDHDVYATYATGNWAISVVDRRLSDGYSSLPTDALVFGGDEELSLYQVPEPDATEEPYPENLTPGKYYLAFEIEAPDGVGDLRDNVNQTEWTYKTDDEEWQSFNGEGEHRFDYTNGSQHLVLKMYKEVTWEMLKDLIDAEDHLKTWTITLAPKDKQDDESAYVVLTVTLDPKNVYLYNVEDFDPVRGIINYNYKFTVSFDMDGGAAIKPIVFEYGDNFLDRQDEIEFEDEELNEAMQAEGNFNQFFKIKKYFVWYGFGYYENEGEEELSEIEMADGLFYGDGFIVRRDQSVYALYMPMPLRLAFFDKTGEQIGEYYTDRRQFNNFDEWMEGAYGIGSPLNLAEVPEGLAAQYGTTTWYPVKLDPDSVGQNPYFIDDDDDGDHLELLRDENGNFQMADAPYDFTSSEIVGDLYYDERQLDPEDPKNEGYIINSEAFMYGPFMTASYMGVIIDEQDGLEVAFLGSDYDEADPLSDTFYTFNESGDLTFGEIEVPTFDEEELAERGMVFNGWLLLDEDHTDDETWGDLKPFNFEKNASKSVKGKELDSWDFDGDEHENVVVFAPSFTYLNGGQATLYSANVFFEGAIKMIFKYNFRYWDRSTEHYVVFRQGEEELARVPLKNIEPDETGVDGYNNERGDRYLIYCPVPIVNYTDPINVRVETADGEEWYTTTGKGAEVEGGYDYSLQKYAENKASSTNEKMAALAKALQDYGIAARLFVGKDVGDLALSAAVTGLEVSDMKVEETVVTAKDERPDGITASQNVVFSFDNTLQVTFKGCDANCTFTLDGDPWEGELVDGNAVMEVPNIAPNELDTPHTFTCTKGGKTFEVKTSVLGYAKRTADKGSAEMKNLAKALYVYAKAAIAYVG